MNGATSPLTQAGSAPRIGDSLESDNRFYWTNRAASYSVQNRLELEGHLHDKWMRELVDSIRRAHPDADPREISVLDIGCGPGIFSILLAQAGFTVTAVDYTPSMIAQAHENARAFGCTVGFQLMNAEELAFADESFDAIVTRNLTWNLPHPFAAYREWARVLKAGGIMLNFDANWYSYLYDADARRAQEARELVGNNSMDCRQGAIVTDVDAMESIALRVPLSQTVRPAWDESVLSQLGLDARIDVHVGERIWTEEERANFKYTPLFKVETVKR